MREMQQICVGLGDDDEKNYGNNKLRSSSQKKMSGFRVCSYNVLAQ